MFNLVDSHDTMRIKTRVENNTEIVKLCYLFIFTFPGAPAIYYGDEIGLEGKEDPDSRRCMIWNDTLQDKALYSFFKKMIELRKEYPDFSSVELFWHKADNNVLIYQKDHMTVFINNNNYTVDEKVPAVIRKKNVLDLFENKKQLLGKEVTLIPYSFKILYNK